MKLGILVSIAPVTNCQQQAQANSAYLMIVNTTNGNSNNYILDISLYETTIDFAGYLTGIYSVSLICDGNIADSTLLIID